MIQVNEICKIENIDFETGNVTGEKYVGGFWGWWEKFETKLHISDLDGKYILFFGSVIVKLEDDIINHFKKPTKEIIYKNKRGDWIIEYHPGLNTIVIENPVKNIRSHVKKINNTVFVPQVKCPKYVEKRAIEAFYKKCV